MDNKHARGLEFVCSWVLTRRLLLGTNTGGQDFLWSSRRVARKRDLRVGVTAKGKKDAPVAGERDLGRRK